MRLLLPLAVERGTCIITNMGAMDPVGAQEKVVELASSLGLGVSVAVAHEVSSAKLGSGSSTKKSYIMEGVRIRVLALILEQLLLLNVWRNINQMLSLLHGLPMLPCF